MSVERERERERGREGGREGGEIPYSILHGAEEATLGVNSTKHL